MFQMCPLVQLDYLTSHPINIARQRLSQDLETGCLKLAAVKSLGVQMFKGDHNILIFQP